MPCGEPESATPAASAARSRGSVGSEGGGGGAPRCRGGIQNQPHQPLRRRGAARAADHRSASINRQFEPVRLGLDDAHVLGVEAADTYDPLEVADIAVI